MFYRNIKLKKSVIYCFSPPYISSTFFLEPDGENIFFEEICNRVLSEAVESGIKLSQFVDLRTLLFLLAACKIYIIKQIKKTLPTFPSCSQIPVAFYDSVIDGLGFLTC